MIKIRTWDPDEDFGMICAWGLEIGNAMTEKEIYPPTTYIAEYNGIPILSCSLLLMNAPGCAKVENLVGNPAFKDERKEALPMMFRHIEEIAKAWGYKHLVLFSYIEKLSEKYEMLGYRKTLSGVSTFHKRIGE